MPDISQEEYRLLESRLADHNWRLSTLYKIVDKHSNVLTFKMKPIQTIVDKTKWYLNVILKSRQHGITTYMAILLLDICLFRPNKACGIIAHRKEDAQNIFNKKIIFAYDNLPQIIKAMCPIKSKTKTSIDFANGSSIYVSTSFRSGTIHYLHISEYGYICQKAPERAKEIQTGALNAIAIGMFITIEATAKGKGGDFAKICSEAMARKHEGTKLTKMDYKFFFFAWWQDPDCVLEEGYEDVIIHDRLRVYFEELEKKLKITLSAKQKAFYVKKEESQGDDMKREFPSTPEECFQESLDGTYYPIQFEFLRHNNRITKIDVIPNDLVHTCWDIGGNDETAIWFYQKIAYGEYRFIDYYEYSGIKGMGHFYDVLMEKRYRYGYHILPHDARHKHQGDKLRVSSYDILKGYNMNVLALPKTGLMDGIQTARNFLLTCWFDEERCEKGLDNLESYRKEWDSKRGAYRDIPYHGPESNGADALRYGAVYETALLRSPRKARERMMQPNGAVKSVMPGGRTGMNRRPPRVLNPRGYT